MADICLSIRILLGSAIHERGAMPGKDLQDVERVHYPLEEHGQPEKLAEITPPNGAFRPLLLLPCDSIVCLQILHKLSQYGIVPAQILATAGRRKKESKKRREPIFLMGKVEIEEEMKSRKSSRSNVLVIRFRAIFCVYSLATRGQQEDPLPAFQGRNLRDWLRCSLWK